MKTATYPRGLPRAFRRNDVEPTVIRELLGGVWGLDMASRSAGYIQYYHDLFRRVLVGGVSLKNPKQVVELVQFIRDRQQKALSKIRDELVNADPEWVNGPIDDLSAQQIFELVIRLWLLIEPKAVDLKKDLKDVVHESLPKSSVPEPGMLSSDFSAKTLTRKAGMRLVYTSCLSDHLEFVGRSQLKIFCHASVLRQYTKSSERELYPQGLLEETEKTLRLLFDPVNAKSSRRTKRICDRDEVDLEVAIFSHASKDLCNYPYWHERLRDIQKAYDQAKPREVKQWWYDRRRPFEWSTLWVAVLVFILTVFFGMISSVTGIMQVYASFKSL